MGGVCNVMEVMRSSNLFAVSAALLSVSAHAYQLPSGNAKIVEPARARYYNLSAAGFQSLRCSVKFDFSTVPLLPSATNDSTRRLLEATVFTLILDDKGRPSLQHRYPTDAGETLQQQASQEINLLSSFIVGLFQTWPTKGLQGPVPPFDSQIESAESTDRGYAISLRVPGGPVQILLDKSYLVTEIVSSGGKIHEHPDYAPSPEGLIFVGNDAIDDSGQGGRVEVKYDLGTSVLDGLRVPSSARIRVNQNIDVKFNLDGCVVQKAKVFKIDPPHVGEKPSI
jgi:hypothetical protein